MDAVFKHALVATDGSPAADAAIGLARRLGGATRVTALLVMHDYGMTEYVRAALSHRVDAQELREHILAEGRRLLDQALARTMLGDARIERRVVIGEKAPCHEIVATAQHEGCDLIVMAPHGFGGGLPGLLGSQARAVLALATVPVLIAR